MSENAMPEINPALCILCGYCLVTCPAGALSRTEQGIHLDENRCVYCGDCEAVCPNGAISLPYEIRLKGANTKAAGTLPYSPADQYGPK